MKKVTKKINFKKYNLFLKIAAGISLITISFGVVFGISARTFKLSYVDLFNKQKRLEANRDLPDDKINPNKYNNQNSVSEWNMDGDFVQEPTKREATKDERDQRHQPFFDKKTNGELIGVKYYDGSNPIPSWENLNPLDKKHKDEIRKIMQQRYRINKFILDGKDHTPLDHSFNQSLYTGLIRYIHGGMNYKNGQATYGIYDDDIDFPTNAKFSDIKIDQNISHVAKPDNDTSNDLQRAYEGTAADATPELPFMLQCVGFNHVTPLGNYGSDSNIKIDKDGKKYLDLKGAISNSAIFLYDGTVSNNQNISSNLFRADQSTFLCALATCCFFLKNIDIYYNDNHPMSIGIFGGVNIPTVSIFLGGIQRGVEIYNRYILPNIVENLGKESVSNDFPQLVKFAKKRNWNISTEIDKQKIIKNLSVQIISLDKTNAYFSNSFVQGDAIEISQTLLNREADAIICVAGPQGVDTAQAIKSRSSNCIMIGVDSAMELSDFQRSSSSPIKTNDPSELDPMVKDGIFKFSATKNICYFAQKQSELFTQDLNWDITWSEDSSKPDPKRSICSIGYNTNGNLLNGGCGISESGWYYLATILQYLKLRSEKDSGLKSFVEIWNGNGSKDIQEQFKKDHEHEINVNKIFEHKFEDLVVVPTSINVSEDSVNKSLIDNYALYTEFLGEILDKYGLEFKDDETAVDKGFSSILKWIDDNMYFIS